MIFFYLIIFCVISIIVGSLFIDITPDNVNNRIFTREILPKNKTNIKKLEENSLKKIEKNTSSKLEKNSSKQLKENTSEQLEKNNSKEIKENSLKKIEKNTSSKLEENNSEQLEKNNSKKIKENNSEQLEKNNSSELKKNTSTKLEKNSSKKIKKNSEDISYIKGGEIDLINIPSLNDLFKKLSDFNGEFSFQKNIEIKNYHMFDHNVILHFKESLKILFDKYYDFLRMLKTLNDKDRSDFIDYIESVKYDKSKIYHEKNILQEYLSTINDLSKLLSYDDNLAKEFLNNKLENYPESIFKNKVLTNIEDDINNKNITYKDLIRLGNYLPEKSFENIIKIFLLNNTEKNELYKIFNMLEIILSDIDNNILVVKGTTAIKTSIRGLLSTGTGEKTNLNKYRESAYNIIENIINNKSINLYINKLIKENINEEKIIKMDISLVHMYFGKYIPKDKIILKNVFNECIDILLLILINMYNIEKDKAENIMSRILELISNNKNIIKIINLFIKI